MRGKKILVPNYMLKLFAFLRKIDGNSRYKNDTEIFRDSILLPDNIRDVEKLVKLYRKMVKRKMNLLQKIYDSIEVK